MRGVLAWEGEWERASSRPGIEGGKRRGEGRRAVRLAGMEDGGRDDGGGGDRREKKGQ